MTGWEFVKHRTASDGAVWRSPDGLLYRRTGGEDLAEEAAFQRRVAGLGYPVPEVVADGVEDSWRFFTEQSIGGASLHDQAVADAGWDGFVSDRVLDTATAVSRQLLQAQISDSMPTSPAGLRDWFTRAGLPDNVFTENPDLDTSRVHRVIGHAIGRLDDLPMCHSHMDYGLPNVFPGGVIDWQHHGWAPLGYDVYPMLDIVAYKGGGKGYGVGPEQRARYLASLDEVSAELYGTALSKHLGDFLFVKSFFFLALMRPSDPSRQSKHAKWQYRRMLFTTGLEQYESSNAIDTGTFPTLAEFAADA